MTAERSMRKPVMKLVLMLLGITASEKATLHAAEPTFGLLYQIDVETSEPLALNNQNQVAHLTLGNDRSKWGIYRSDAYGSTLISPVFTDPVYNGIQGVSMNDHGFVSYGSFGDNEYRVLAGDGNALLEVGSGSFVSPLGFDISKQSISDVGEMVWREENTIYRGIGGVKTPVTLPANIQPIRATISGDGRIAVATRASSGAYELYLCDLDGQITLIRSSIQGLSVGYLNDLGDILFNGSEGLLLQRNGFAPDLISTDGAYERASMNNTGGYSFLVPDNPSLPYDRTLYAYIPEFDVLRRVIGEGDSFLGSTIDDLRFGPLGMNDAGNVAFTYSLADGRDGIAVVATVPEVSSGVLLGITAIGACAARKSWRRRSNETCRSKGISPGRNHDCRRSGSDTGIGKTAKALGLESSLHAPHRLRKTSSLD